jgi:hypothetical protein
VNLNEFNLSTGVVSSVVETNSTKNSDQSDRSDYRLRNRSIGKISSGSAKVTAILK